MAGDFVDITSDANPARHQGEPAGRRFLGIHFDCCGTYTRIYLQADRQRYIGHCPKCMRRVEFRIGEGGSDSRFFHVS